MKRIAVGILGIGLLIAAGCGGGTNDSGDTPETAAAPQAALPDGLFLAKAPAGPLSVLDLKSADRTGEEVVVEGQIGGQAAPFVEGRAMFTMTDLTLPVCDAAAGDSCETPWDSCCETPESIQANMITVQVVDENGDVVKHGIQGENGLKGLARLTVRGTVSQQSGDVLVVDAREIYVHQDAA